MLNEILQKCPLGKETAYLTSYDPSLLFSIPRQQTRENINITSPLPFDGEDIWYAYELSWLDPKGKPHVAIAKYILPCSSPYLIESKSLKTYLHSFNNTSFKNASEVQLLLQKDLSKAAGTKVNVRVFLPKEFQNFQMKNFEGVCLDDLEITANVYNVDPLLLKTHPNSIEERLYSNLLKSNCLVTSQPDWGHVYIHYSGNQIDHDSLLKYIISYRNHNGFHEQCVERIFVDLQKYCQLEKLTVYGRYTRRGGVDINVFRSNWQKNIHNQDRLFRQ